MVKLKFVLMLLVLTLIAFGGWGYTAYQLQVVQNNHTEVVAPTLPTREQRLQNEKEALEAFITASKEQQEKKSNVDPSRYTLNGMAERRQQRRLEQEQKDKQNAE